MVYFTADMHFGHRAIIAMQNRPFGSIEEMDSIILQNYYAVINRDDTVYILGDVCHHMKIDAARAEGIRRFDVGVDANNFHPVSAKQIIDYFNQQEKADDSNTL